MSLHRKQETHLQVKQGLFIQMDQTRDISEIGLLNEGFALSSVKHVHCRSAKASKSWSTRGMQQQLLRGKETYPEAVGSADSEPRAMDVLAFTEVGYFKPNCQSLLRVLESVS